jgi:hypothetical protein
MTSVALVLLSLLGVAALMWWALSWDMDRFIRNRKGTPLHPESQFVAAITDTEVVVRRPDGTIERVAIAAVKEIYIVTTSAGPWSADVWWLFVGSDAGKGCSFPSGATGENDLVAFVQQLPGFDNKTFITAMGSTANARFLCWRATAA